MGKEQGGGKEYPQQETTRGVIGAAMEVHGTLGHGFCEPVYQEALERELTDRQVRFLPQPAVEVRYKGIPLRKKFRPDFLVDDTVVVEIKAGTALTRTDQSQLLNYLKAAKRSVGLLLNFGSPSLQIKRMVL
jgi:GxxExxY protein